MPSAVKSLIVLSQLCLKFGENIKEMGLLKKGKHKLTKGSEILIIANVLSFTINFH